MAYLYSAQTSEFHQKDITYKVLAEHMHSLVISEWNEFQLFNEINDNRKNKMAEERYIEEKKKTAAG